MRRRKRGRRRHRDLLGFSEVEVSLRVKRGETSHETRREWRRRRKKKRRRPSHRLPRLRRWRVRPAA
jgi:hypothetical protein